MDNKKNFELTTETRKMFGRTLFRIKALKSFNDVKVGDLGGFIEKEENLSENAWVCNDACVYGNARVYGVVKICDTADLSNNNDYIYFKCLGSSLTFFICKDGHIHVSWDDTATFNDDSFDGSLYAFEKEVKKLQNNKYDEYAKGYLPCIEIVKIHFGLTDDEV